MFSQSQVFYIMQKSPRDYDFPAIFDVVVFLKPATHWAILFADRGEFNRQPAKTCKRFSPPIDADTPGDFFADPGDCSDAPSYRCYPPF